MRWIKFTFSNGHEVTLSEDVANKILNSGEKIIRITDEFTGKWTGDTINLAFLVSTEPDGYVDRMQQIRKSYLRESDPEARLKIEKIYEEEKRKLIGNRS